MIRCLYIIIGVALMMGCTDGRYDAVLSQIDTLMEAHPDSALLRLDSIRSLKESWPKRLRMRYDLLEAKAQNKAFVDFTSDSIAKEFTKYYDSHGTANERMMAHYLLGCVYRDLGEAPHAVDCYLDAISQADTTAKDCDFNTLSVVYSQMAGVYYDQLLLSNSIEAYRNASHFAFLAHNIKFGILDLEGVANAYILMNKEDSAEFLLKGAQQLYLKYGYNNNAIQSSTKLLHMYVEKLEKQNESKLIIDKYDKESEFFDANHELLPSKRQFYYYKGKFFETANQLDSAEYYYRKVYRPNMDFVSLNPMYEGLLSVFKKRHQPDSIAKYAQLYCEVNDSSIAKKDQELTAQMAASYNYNRYQKEALDNEKKAHRVQLMLIAFIITSTVIATIIFLLWRRNKKQHEALRMEYANASDEYNKNLQTLQLLESLHQELYEAKKQELCQENDILKKRIDDLKRQEGIRLQITKSQQFTETEIVKRIKYLIEHPLSDITETEWDQLLATSCVYIPSLLHDLNNLPKITQQEIRVCLLICLSVRESDIARFLNISPQRVTNMKSSLNRELFGDESARTLYKNLTQHYEIYTL